MTDLATGSRQEREWIQEDQHRQHGREVINGATPPTEWVRPGLMVAFALAPPALFVALPGRSR
jgi:hypothetical protein